MAAGGIRRSLISWAWLAALALGLKALLPSGWMPVADIQGPRLVLCTAQGAQPQDPDRPAGEGTRAPDLCAFAGQAGAALPPAGASGPDAVMAAAMRPRTAARGGRPRSPLRRLRPPAQAPPVR